MTKIKSARHYATDFVGGYGEDNVQKLAALILQAQAEAWEAGREAAADWVFSSPNDPISMFAIRDGIRALPNPFVDVSERQPHPIECDDERRAKVRGGRQ